MWPCQDGGGRGWWTQSVPGSGPPARWPGSPGFRPQSPPPALGPGWTAVNTMLNMDNHSAERIMVPSANLSKTRCPVLTCQGPEASLTGMYYICTVYWKIVKIPSRRGEKSADVIWGINRKTMQEHAAWARTCSMGTDMQYEYGHAAWTWTWTSSMLMSLVHDHVPGAWSCPCCMLMSLLYAHVPAACPCPCCMSMSLLHVHVPAACPCPCCMSMSLLHAHVPAACLCSCCMSMSVLHGLEQVVNK